MTDDEVRKLFMMCDFRKQTQKLQILDIMDNLQLDPEKQCRLFQFADTTKDEQNNLPESEINEQNPGANILQGFGNIMPVNVAAEMTDQQIDDIISFIESLQ